MDPTIYYVPDKKDVLKRIIIILIVCMAGVYNLIYVNKYLILFITFFIITSQIVYVFGISSITQIIDQIYPLNERNMVWTHRSIENINELTSVNIRAGGIYRNPNQFTKYINLLYIIILNCRFSEKFKYLSLFLIFGSILLTGSRTGIIVFAIVNIIYFKKRSLIPYLFL